jgi:hypothetical protein
MKTADQFKSAADQCRLMRADSAPIETILNWARSKGFNKVESTLLLQAAGIASYPESKELVHGSEAWADARESDDQLHEVLEQAIQSRKQEPS